MEINIDLRFQVVEDGYEFFSKRQLVTLFSAPNYCGEFDNAGAMMSVDDSLMCSFQILKVSLLEFVEWVIGLKADVPHSWLVMGRESSMVVSLQTAAGVALTIWA